MLAVEKIVERKFEEILDLEPQESAKVAGLCYVRADDLLIVRKKVGRGFSYIDANGDRIADEAELDRLKSLTIPPALTDVRLCHLPDGHLQATGRDAKRRKQYFYHPQWRKIRSQHKFNRMLLFGAHLPAIRETTDQHLRKHGLPREKVLAAVVQLLETTLIRVGNNRYAKKNSSFGLTTLRDRHVEIKDSKVKFEFRGKSGVDHEIELNDRRLANVIKQCQEIPGYEVFKYYDESGDRQFVDSEDVNEYLQTITTKDFTAKDFRTWAGTLLAAIELNDLGGYDSEPQAQKNVTQAIKNVAQQLGNRPATCRKYYVHPAIIAAYNNKSLLDLMSQTENFKSAANGLNPEEIVILEIIKEALPIA
ncbi:DNA topoisomerase IB [Pleurocapsa sp. PCC 7319]|uniref:DNA topoisomerase IB n=1 Tax=Pleurocapsa sp. PCC 7319 TaxID=118161 RepID=UPI0003455D8A|nr:DNA topoisomerase IB [Pleurocapsa sp. PCC 7319]